MTEDFVSRRKAAEILRVSTGTVDKICLLNGIKPYQIPGHSRALYPLVELHKLVDVANGGRA